MCCASLSSHPAAVGVLGPSLTCTFLAKQCPLQSNAVRGLHSLGIFLWSATATLLDSCLASEATTDVSISAEKAIPVAAWRGGCQRSVRIARTKLAVLDGPWCPGRWRRWWDSRSCFHRGYPVFFQLNVSVGRTKGQYWRRYMYMCVKRQEKLAGGSVVAARQIHQPKFKTREMYTPYVRFRQTSRSSLMLYDPTSLWWDGEEIAALGAWRWGVWMEGGYCCSHGLII